MALANLTADVLIIGGGPAGLATALALSRQLYKAVLFDSGVYRNSITHHMHTVPTWDHQDPREYRAAARKELTDRYHTTTLVGQKVEKLMEQPNGRFEALDATGKSWTGKKVVLASGVKDIFPDIKGYEECWGKGIFHCLFCHGYEESGADRAGLLAVGVTANKPFAIAVACMAKQLAKSVTIFTHGDLRVTEEVKSEAGTQNLNVDARQIARFEKVPGDTSAIRIHFEDGSESEEIGFMAHGPRTQPTTPWHEQLGLELSETGDFKSTPPFGETSVHGVFVAGDCGHMMKAVLPALSSGSMAAAGAAHQMSQGK